MVVDFIPNARVNGTRDAKRIGFDCVLRLATTVDRMKALRYE